MALDNQTITFIGGGNMAEALAGGLIASGVAPHNIRVGEPNAERRAELERQYGIRTSADNAALIEGADAVIFAVKPQMLPAVARDAADAIAATRPLVVSIAAGVTTAALADWLASDTPIVRVMPNTPALVGCGAAGLFAGNAVTDEQRQTAEVIMRAAGEAIWIQEESLMDAVTAVSGSGPAYFFLIIEAMEAAGVELGLDPADARRLVAQTALGAASMVKAGDAEPAELRRRVTSPGGTTAAALDQLEKGGMRELFSRGLKAARDRSQELAGS